MEEQEKQKMLEEIKDSVEKERTMKLSVKEGCASSVMGGLGDSYISAYALALKANNLQIGLLSSFVGLIGPITQIFGSKLMERYRRKKIIFTSVALQALMWFPILFLSLFFYKDILRDYLPILLIIFYSLYAILGSFASPSWFSLMGDLVPENVRGKYFSRRNRICGTVVLVTTLIAAFVLDYYKTRGYLLLVFSIFFFISGIARLISAYSFKKHYDPEFKLNKGYYFSFFDFVRKSPNNNFGKFVIYSTLIYFSVQIAGPFFTVYMLKDLGFSYLNFTLVNISPSIIALLTLPLLGKLSDKYGNREILKIGGILVPFIPIFWLFSSSPIYLILVPQVISGIGWTAFNFAASNFIYDSVSVQRRGLCVAYYNLMIGIGIFFGAAIGGLLANYIKIGFMNPLLFIFLISGILRLGATLFMMPMIKEVRQKVAKPKSNPLLYFKDMRPVREMFFEMAHELRIIGKKGGKIFNGLNI